MGEVKKMFASFAGKTSMHGAGFLASAGSLKARVFWSLVCLASMGMFVFMLSGLVIHYLSFPVLVKVEEVGAGKPNYL